MADTVANGGSILADVVPTKDEVDSGSASLWNSHSYDVLYGIPNTECRI